MKKLLLLISMLLLSLNSWASCIAANLPISVKGYLFNEEFVGDDVGQTNTPYKVTFIRVTKNNTSDCIIAANGNEIKLESVVQLLQPKDIDYEKKIEVSKEVTVSGVLWLADGSPSMVIPHVIAQYSVEQ